MLPVGQRIVVTSKVLVSGTLPARHAIIRPRKTKSFYEVCLMNTAAQSQVSTQAVRGRILALLTDLPPEGLTALRTQSSTSGLTFIQHSPLFQNLP